MDLIQKMPTHQMSCNISGIRGITIILWIKKNIWNYLSLTYQNCTITILRSTINEVQYIEHWCSRLWVGWDNWAETCVGVRQCVLCVCRRVLCAARELHVHPTHGILPPAGLRALHAPRRPLLGLLLAQPRGHCRPHLSRFTLSSFTYTFTFLPLARITTMSSLSDSLYF